MVAGISSSCFLDVILEGAVRMTTFFPLFLVSFFGIHTLITLGVQFYVYMYVYNERTKHTIVINTLVKEP